MTAIKIGPWRRELVKLLSDPSSTGSFGLQLNRDRAYTYLQFIYENQQDSHRRAERHLLFAVVVVGFVELASRSQVQELDILGMRIANIGLLIRVAVIAYCWFVSHAWRASVVAGSLGYRKAQVLNLLGVTESSPDEVGFSYSGINLLSLGSRTGRIARVGEGIGTVYLLSITIAAVIIAGHVTWVAWRATGLDLWLVLVVIFSSVLLFMGMLDISYAIAFTRQEDPDTRRFVRWFSTYRRLRRDTRRQVRVTGQTLIDRYQSMEKLPWWTLARKFDRLRRYYREYSAATQAAVRERDAAVHELLKDVDDTDHHTSQTRRDGA